MSLPSSRNTTYVAADPVLSNDLNAIQDTIIAGKHGDMEIAIAGGAATAATALISSAGVWQFTGAGEVVIIPINLPVGKRIKLINHRFNRAGSGSMTMRFMSVAVGASTNINTVSDAATTGWQAVNSAVLATVLATGVRYILEVSGNNAVNRYSHAVITFDHP